MQNKPLLSIVTSIYNGGANLKGFLECISNQTYENIEVIIIEDCSTDKETLQIVADLESGILPFNKPFKLIKNEKNLGLFESFQKGLDHATGNYIAFPESDDFLDLDFYETLMNEIISHNNIDVVQGLLLSQVSDTRTDKDLFYNDDAEEDDLKIVSVLDEMCLPIPMRNSTGQIISYLMPDITYSWFYVFSKNLLSDGYDKPMFKNAVFYGFSNTLFTLKYKEVKVPLDKASFYYYNTHDRFENGGILAPIIEDSKDKQHKKLITDKLFLENILNQYKNALEEFGE
ncbi:MAG: glycosyltransferase [Bacilli bacterium]|nr:glycosyltransferase [Bacilli bacterium]